MTRERPIRHSAWLSMCHTNARETDSGLCALVEQECACMSAPGAGWVHQQWYLAANPAWAYHPVPSETVSPPSSALINQTKEGSGSSECATLHRTSGQVRSSTVQYSTGSCWRSNRKKVKDLSWNVFTVETSTSIVDVKEPLKSS